MVPTAAKRSIGWSNPARRTGMPAITETMRALNASPRLEWGCSDVVAAQDKGIVMLALPMRTRVIRRSMLESSRCSALMSPRCLTALYSSFLGLAPSRASACSAALASRPAPLPVAGGIEAQPCKTLLLAVGRKIQARDAVALGNHHPMEACRDNPFTRENLVDLVADGADRDRCHRVDEVDLPGKLGRNRIARKAG